MKFTLGLFLSFWLAMNPAFAAETFMGGSQKGNLGFASCTESECRIGINGGVYRMKPDLLEFIKLFQDARSRVRGGQARTYEWMHDEIEVYFAFDSKDQNAGPIVFGIYLPVPGLGTIFSSIR